MLTRFNDIDRTFTFIDQFRRRMDRLIDEYDRAEAGGGDEAELLSRGAFPALRFFDDGAGLVLKVDLPGLSEKDVKLTLQQDVLTLSGERKPDAPEGYYAHRQERAPVKFARSFTLPCRVDPEKTSASMKDGVMTVALTKAADAQPRQIAIKAQ
jgi:HSP20 family protein